MKMSLQDLWLFLLILAVFQPSPHGCRVLAASWVKVDKDCFESGENIFVHFHNEGEFLRPPLPTDFVAIYHAGRVQDLENLPSNRPMWAWACGRRADQGACAEPVQVGSINFGPSLGPWPLEAGNYVAVLSGSPILPGFMPERRAFAVSSSFLVKSPQQSCNGGGMAPPRPPSSDNGSLPTGEPPHFAPLPLPETPFPTLFPTLSPNLSPTPWPTVSLTPPPTPWPTVSLTPPPTPSPTPQPTPPPPTPPAPTPTPPTPTPDNNNNVGGDADMFEVLSKARADIAALIDENIHLGAKFLRLAFHDCVGGCDGCVDFSNPDNAGLGAPISALIPIVTKYDKLGLTRPDIWALAAAVASQELQPQNPELLTLFPFNWIGRQTCGQLVATKNSRSGKNDCGTNFLGQASTCSALAGPHRELCHGSAGTDKVLDFFDKEFNMDAQQTVAIMGAHTVGTMRRQVLGFDAENGWDLTNTRFDNGWMVELVGHPGDTEEDLPDWEVVVVDNRDLGGEIPNRPQWEATVKNKKIAMLNSDMAMARQVDDGQVQCTFRAGVNRCPDSERTIGHMKRYAVNTRTFIEDFRDALDIVLENGYTRTSEECPQGRVCRLSPRLPAAS